MDSRLHWGDHVSEERPLKVLIRQIPAPEVEIKWDVEGVKYTLTGDLYLSANGDLLSIFDPINPPSPDTKKYEDCISGDEEYFNKFRYHVNRQNNFRIKINAPGGIVLKTKVSKSFQDAVDLLEDAFLGFITIEWDDYSLIKTESGFLATAMGQRIWLPSLAELDEKNRLHLAKRRKRRVENMVYDDLEVKRQEEQRIAERRQEENRLAEERRQEEQRLAEERRQEEAKRLAEERRQEEAKRLAEKRQEEAKRLSERQLAKPTKAKPKKNSAKEKSGNIPPEVIEELEDFIKIQTGKKRDAVGKFKSDSEGLQEELSSLKMAEEKLQGERDSKRALLKLNRAKENLASVRAEKMREILQQSRNLIENYKNYLLNNISPNLQVDRMDMTSGSHELGDKEQAWIDREFKTFYRKRKGEKLSRIVYDFNIEVLQDDEKSRDDPRYLQYLLEVHGDEIRDELDADDRVGPKSELKDDFNDFLSANSSTKMAPNVAVAKFLSTPIAMEKQYNKDDILRDLYSEFVTDDIKQEVEELRQYNRILFSWVQHHIKEVDEVQKMADEALATEGDINRVVDNLLHVTQVNSPPSELYEPDEPMNVRASYRWNRQLRRATTNFRKEIGSIVDLHDGLDDVSEPADNYVPKTPELDAQIQEIQDEINDLNGNRKSKLADRLKRALEDISNSNVEGFRRFKDKIPDSDMYDIISGPENIEKQFNQLYGLLRFVKKNNFD